jgi:thiamine-phosphate pyrophosphorylase
MNLKLPNRQRFNKDKQSARAQLDVLPPAGFYGLLSAMKEQFGLYLILTDPAAGYEACAEAAVESGVRYLQLRMKDAPESDILSVARALRRITAGSATRLIINDSPAVAVEVDADGLHLGQTDGSLAEARAMWKHPGKILGLSTHNEEQAREAPDCSPDYIGVGPVFPTRTKADTDPVLGIERAAGIISASPLTAVAIGGIDAANLPSLLAAGIDNFCVVSAVNRAADPRAAIRRLQRIWEEQRF